MSETANLGLPLLQPAQAQKHVTVNEALVRVDGMTQLSLLSTTVATPPVSAQDGDSFAVPVGAVNEWDGHEGEVAIYSNGGWVFLQPRIGWRGWIAELGALAVFDGSSWVSGAISVSPNRAALVVRAIEFDQPITAGASIDCDVQLPGNTMILAISGRVKAAISGTLNSWKLGFQADEDRYGSGYGLAVGTPIVGLFSRPNAFSGDTILKLTAEGGEFTGGEVRLVLHFYEVTAPSV